MCGILAATASCQWQERGTLWLHMGYIMDHYITNESLLTLPDPFTLEINYV